MAPVNSHSIWHPYAEARRLAEPRFPSSRRSPQTAPFRNGWGGKLGPFFGVSIFWDPGGTQKCVKVGGKEFFFPNVVKKLKETIYIIPKFKKLIRSISGGVGLGLRKGREDPL